MMHYQAVVLDKEVAVVELGMEQCLVQQDMVAVVLYRNDCVTGGFGLISLLLM